MSTFSLDFSYQEDEPLIYKMKFTTSEWKKIVDGFPESLHVTSMPPFSDQGYSMNIRNSKKSAKCATCKKELNFGDIQATTEGPYRTIQRKWIIRTFYYCPQMKCIM